MNPGQQSRHAQEPKTRGRACRSDVVKTRGGGSSSEVTRSGCAQSQGKSGSSTSRLEMEETVDRAEDTRN